MTGVMKKLYIIRHAKSSWDDPNLRDHDRPLNARGERDKVIMARFVKANFTDIEMLYTSTAMRALDYAVAIHIHSGLKLEVDETLYTFDSRTLLRFFLRLPERYSSVGIVSHNPAVTEIINHLAQLDERQKITNLPTSAIAVIECDVQKWSELAANSGTVVDFARPKFLTKNA